MTITSLSFAGGIQQPSLQKTSAQVQAAIASIVSGQASSSASDVASVSVASQLQSESAALRQLSGNIAQGSSLLQVAEGGVSQIGAALQQLQALAQQSQSPTVNPDIRRQLNEQFQQIADQVDSIAGGTSFNGQSLLNGGLSGDNALSIASLTGIGGGGDSLSIGNLSSSSLLGGPNVNIQSPDAAGQAVNALGRAIDQVTAVSAGLGSLQQTVDYAAANVDSALANQEAARASLQDTNIATASTQYALADIQQNAGIALAAQGNNLSPALLQLIG